MRWRSLLRDDTAYLAVGLFHAARFSFEEVEEHEGKLGSYVVAEMVEEGTVEVAFGHAVFFAGNGFQEDDRFLGCRYRENPVVVTQVDDVAFLVMRCRKTAHAVNEAVGDDGAPWAQAWATTTSGGKPR